MVNTPRISVCMPAYNAESSISRAIESVLVQSLGDYELVIVDDASTDATMELVRSVRDARLRLYGNRENLGQARTSNRALELARGELVKFLHPDDWLEPGCLALLAEPFEARPEVGLAFGRRRVELENPNDPLAVSWKSENAELHSGFGMLDDVNDGPALFSRCLASRFESNWIGEPSCAMVRRECLRRSGTFNLRVRLLHDFDLWLRLIALYDVGFVDTAVCTYRFGTSGVTGASVRHGHEWLDRLWMLESLALLPGVWDDFPGLAHLRRAEVIRRSREVRGLARRGGLGANRVRQCAAYASYRAQRSAGLSPPLLGSL